MWGEQGTDGSPALKVFTRSSALLRPPDVGFAQALRCSCVVPQAREMNPLTKVQLVNKLNEWEAGSMVIAEASWHSEYKDSAWIFLGGLLYELTEGDSLCVFSQYWEIVSISLVRDRKTGKCKGFCLIRYEDQRSTSLTVDNFNGIKIKGRTIRVNHVSSYRAVPLRPQRMWMMPSESSGRRAVGLRSPCLVHLIAWMMRHSQNGTNGKNREERRSK
eukprot:bmy_13971T0